MNFWMVRAEGGAYLPQFRSQGVVSVGFEEAAGSLEGFGSREELKAVMKSNRPDLTKHVLAARAGVLWRFAKVVADGDGVATYDPDAREYLVGRIEGDYLHQPGIVSGEEGSHDHARRVRWETERIGRDRLPAFARNSLGSIMTLFQFSVEVWDALQAALRGEEVEIDEEDLAEELVEEKRDLQTRAHEFIKDRILASDDREAEDLVAAVLRAMGYRTRQTPVGPDRGLDILASPDGLGLQDPRIKVEVKHRKASIGAPDVRSFVGGLRERDRGLYVSTGGFTREARYEADRANNPSTLIDLDELASLVVQYYDGFDEEGRALLPLVRIYWPS